MNPVVRVLTFLPRRIWSSTKSVNNLLLAPTGVSIQESTEKSFIYVTNVLGFTSGAGQAALGTVDAFEAYACQDGVCFVISCVGVTADALQIVASFVPGPNVTTFVTIPVSTFCKTFVRMCKNKKLPWKQVCMIVIPSTKKVLHASLPSKGISLIPKNFV